jgi:hypothetical protein
MFKGADWFNGLVAAAVLVILIAAAGNAVMDLGFDALSLAGAIFLLLMLPILYKMASRHPRKH